LTGNGITGLETIRQQQASQGALLARVDERTQSHSRELDRQGKVIDGVDTKVDGVLTELATTRGITVQKKSTFGGAIALTAVIAAISGVLVSILVRFLP
jgi:hypothetical protein